MNDGHKNQHDYYHGHRIVSQNSPVDTQHLLEQNLENEYQLYLNEWTMAYKKAESRTIIENADQLSNSTAVLNNKYYVPEILDITLDGEILKENDETCLPNIVTPINIDIKIRKVHKRQNSNMMSPKCPVKRLNDMKKTSYEQKQKTPIMSTNPI